MFKTDFEARKAPKKGPKMVPKPVQGGFKIDVILNRAKIDFEQTPVSYTHLTLPTILRV